MTVYFIGAGPGAADLLTMRAHRIISQAPVILYAGSIVPPEVLDMARDDATIINTARMPLHDIISTIEQYHSQGHDIARLQSGDPSIYSSLAEQSRQLHARNIPYEVVPGVASFAAAAAVLGHELTVPEVGQTVILTRVNGRASQMPAGEDLATLGASGATLCIHLAIHDIERVVAELEPNYGHDCPVAVVAYASRPEQQILRGTLATIAQQVSDANIQRTAIIIVGKVLTAKNFPDSFLYSDDRPRDAFGRTIPCAP